MIVRSGRCRISGLALVASALIGGGCDVLADPDEVVVGITETSTSTLFEALSLPDTVRVGEPFPVTLTAPGLSSCWSPSAVRVNTSPERIKLVPTDRIRGGGVCASGKTRLPRTIMLHFPTVGSKTIRMTGRSWNGREPLGSVVRE